MSAARRKTDPVDEFDRRPEARIEVVLRGDVTCSALAYDVALALVNCRGLGVESVTVTFDGVTETYS